MTWQQIQAIADRLEPGLRDTWLRVVRSIAAHITPDAVAKAMAAKGPAARRRALGALLSDARLRPLGEQLERVMRQLAAARLATLGTRRFNPFAVEAARRMAGRRVAQISTTTRAVIRREIVKATKGQQTPAQAAVVIKSAVGLSPRQIRTLDRYREDLQARGLAQAHLDRLTRTRRAQLQRQRARTIARTEAIAAANGGQVATWQALIEAGVIGVDATQRWVVTPDDRLCPRCRPMKGQTVSVGDPFTSDTDGLILFPPLHPNCRCAVVLASAGAQRAADAA